MAFPTALALGMTEEQFWHGDAWLYAAFREAKRRRDDDEAWSQWTMGMYVYDAIQRNVPVLNPFATRKTAYDWVAQPYGVKVATTDVASTREAEEADHQRMIDWMLKARVRGQ